MHSAALIALFGDFQPSAAVGAVVYVGVMSANSARFSCAMGAAGCSPGQSTLRAFGHGRDSLFGLLADGHFFNLVCNCSC